MSAILDQILAKAARLVGAGGILLAARNPSDYQKGFGPGRPTYSNDFLVLHPKGANNAGTWRLPETIGEVVPADAYVDESTEVAGVEVARCAKFKPALGEKYDEAMWLPADFVIDHPWTHRDAQRAVESFERAQTAAAGVRRGANGLERGRGIYFDDQPNGESKMESRSVFAEIQSRAQRAYGDAGAPAPLQGESSHDYECRLMRPHQPRSKQYRESNLDGIRDPIVRRLVADSIYQDSAGYVEPGKQRPVKIRDASGREITKYEGDIGVFMNQFNGPYRHVTKFMIPGHR